MIFKIRGVLAKIRIKQLEKAAKKSHFGEYYVIYKNTDQSGISCNATE
tara:strand:- start:537 stop:680 length:144 start_codon:yes stop_codon:yes gene_type:complete